MGPIGYTSAVVDGALGSAVGLAVMVGGMICFVAVIVLAVLALARRA